MWSSLSGGTQTVSAAPSQPEAAGSTRQLRGSETLSGWTPVCTFAALRPQLRLSALPFLTPQSETQTCGEWRVDRTGCGALCRPSGGPSPAQAAPPWSSTLNQIPFDHLLYDTIKMALNPRPGKGVRWCCISLLVFFFLNGHCTTGGSR